jgi:hypothetical protein
LAYEKTNEALKILSNYLELAAKEINALTEPDEKIPNFDPTTLTGHEWKGKKTGDKQYAKGSCDWGWDFADQFPKETIDILKKGPQTIDKYTFTLSESGNIVQARKAKPENIAKYA